jgi:hypothetical protein
VEAGDVVTHVNEQVVLGVEGFKALLAAASEGRLSLALRRGKMMVFKSIQR